MIAKRKRKPPGVTVFIPFKDLDNNQMLAAALRRLLAIAFRVSKDAEKRP